MPRLWFGLFLVLALVISPIAFASQPDADVPEPVGKSKVSTGIEWKITPGTVVVWLNGKKLGEAQSLGITEAKPGKHVLKLVSGGDEEELEIKVSKGQILTVTYEFES